MFLRLVRIPTGMGAMALLLAVPLLCPALGTVTAVRAAGSSNAGVQGDAQLLLGRWARPDGGYVLELKEIGKDGTATAAYFNPRPINVAKAAVSRRDGALAVFVELRDVNYPGSRYELQYDPKSDQLIGSYFQAVEGQYYTVGFVRLR